MIKVISANLRESPKGQFVTLEIMGAIELVQSQNTGRFYATAKRCFISSTFSLEIAKGLIGQQLSGTIDRMACEPYQYTLPEGGQVITLSHTYSYVPAVKKLVEAKENFREELQEIV
ncbi:MAG TPA: hypothetical protein VK563_20400 [Puia sp.]|nr:hypothetical protein [Puia sp.]